MAVSKTRELGGHDVPTFLYGTAWKEERTAALVRQALAAGFRAIDTANQRKHYHEVGVGEAIAQWLAQPGHARDALFLQSKFTHLAGQDHRLPYEPRAPLGEQVAQSIASSLVHLHTSYLDSFVLHGPSAASYLTDGDWEVWRAMIAAQAAGQTRLLGVSNVGLSHLQELLAGSSIRPHFVQNRCYARTGWDRAVRALCAQHGIVYQGFSLLTANRAELSAPAIIRAAQRTGLTAAQVVFRFALEVGMMPLTGSSDPLHLKEDLAVYEVALSSAEIKAIEEVAGR